MVRETRPGRYRHLGLLSASGNEVSTRSSPRGIGAKDELARQRRTWHDVPRRYSTSSTVRWRDALHREDRSGAGRASRVRAWCLRERRMQRLEHGGRVMSGSRLYAAADPRLFPCRRTEGAADHEALCAAGDSLSLFVSARARVSMSRFTIPRSDRAKNSSGFWKRTARGARHLRQSDDARQCARHIAARAAARMDGDVGGPEPANYADGVSAMPARTRRRRRRRTARWNACAQPASIPPPGSRFPASSSATQRRTVSETGARASDCGPGRAALARSRTDRYRALSGRLARASRQRFGLA